MNERYRSHPAARKPRTRIAGAAKAHSHGLDWNDLRYFLAVAKHGSTVAAARALQTNQSTVQRRLAAFERRIGKPLATRSPSGYRLTELGREMVAHAERVEEAALAFERHLEVATRAVSGVLRVACPEPIVYRITQSPLLGRFAARHPNLRVEFVMSDKYVDLSKGEADVALRSGDTDDGELVGRKIADSLWAVYASRAYVE
ncbi:MAG: LysR family transcriptional regulator, partial [Burkholderiales bacterium]